MPRGTIRSLHCVQRPEVRWSLLHGRPPSPSLSRRDTKLSPPGTALNRARRPAVKGPHTGVRATSHSLHGSPWRSRQDLITGFPLPGCVRLLRRPLPPVVSSARGALLWHPPSPGVGPRPLR